MKKTPELPIPPAALRGSNANELARIWAVDGTQHVSLATGQWDDPACWGIMLVDLMRHIAHAYELEGKRNPIDTLERIREGFEAEWNSPTDTAQGGLLE
jgi:hypothetical protein